jgi:hypothetical protein
MIEDQLPCRKPFSKDKVISLLPDCPPRYNEESQAGWSTSAKDKVISLLPDCPPRYNEEFHEEEMHA